MKYSITLISYFFLIFLISTSCQQKQKEGAERVLFPSLSTDVIIKPLKTGIFITIDPGEEGFIYVKNTPLNKLQTYTEGTHYLPPNLRFKDLYIYGIRQTSQNIPLNVIDIDSNELAVDISINYRIEKGKTPFFHFKVGGKMNSFVKNRTENAAKKVVGKYKCKDIYSNLREKVELGIEEILKEELKDNYIVLGYVFLEDVDLPDHIIKLIQDEEEKKLKLIYEKEIAIRDEYLRKAKAEQDSLLQLNK